MFGRKPKKPRTKLGDLSIVVEQTQIDQYTAIVRQLRNCGGWDISYQAWVDLEPQQELDGHRKIANKHVAETSEGACALAREFVNVFHTRESWKNNRTVCT